MALLEINEATFRSHYNREPFMFRHHLAQHPLLSLSGVFDLAKRHPREEILHWDGSIPVSANIDSAAETHAVRVSLEDAIRNVETAGSYVLIRNAQLDPECGKLVDEVMKELQRLTEPIDPGMCDRFAYIFVAAPGAVTPYHMDRDINFLLQIQGNKRIHVWNARDRSVLPEAGLETLFGDWTARRPEYKPEFQSKAHVFELEPGLGVHQPFTSPHWVQNHDNVSVSIAMTFRSKAAHRQAGVHVFNYVTRRQLGITPTPFGQSQVLDTLKYGALTGYRKLKSVLNARR
jgi:hypothetical protein